jgi:DNA-binding NarL/FixJ family response regulator
MLRLLVIDDQERFGALVRASVGRDPGFEAVEHATNVPDGLALIGTFEPDIVAVNVHVGPSDGIASIAQITERHPNVRVVVLAAFPDAPMMQRAAAANARSFHPKNAGPARLLWLLRNTGHEGFTVHPDVLDQVSGGGLLRPRQGGSASLSRVPSQ